MVSSSLFSLEEQVGDLFLRRTLPLPNNVLDPWPVRR